MDRLKILLLMSFENLVLAATCGHETFQNVGAFLHPKTAAGFLFTSTASREVCFSTCLSTPNCWSLYHNPNSNSCFLASLGRSVVPDTTYSNIPANQFTLYRKTGGHASCLSLLQAYPAATDGDYWLFPTSTLVHPNAVKVYCHQMSTGSPKEYISFPVMNRGEYPNKTFQKCRNPQNYLSGCPGQNGIYKYWKIRVDITNMIVDRTDRTFVNGSGVLRDYAWVGDCYTELDSVYTCGPLGDFTVNTVGTGLIIDPALAWTTSGYKAKVVRVNSQGGAVIALTCGGYPGSCAPNGQMVLHLNTADNVNPASATFKP